MARSLQERELRSYRTLTQSGIVQFEETVERYLSKLRKQNRHIDDCLKDFNDNPPTVPFAIRSLQTELFRLSCKYDTVSNEYVSFLNASRTAASTREEASHRLVASSVRDRIAKALEKMELHLVSVSNDITVVHDTTQNVKSSRSVTSKATSNSQLLQKTAKLEAAKTRLRFVEEEVELLKKQASIQADMKLLQSRRELAEVESSLEAIRLTSSDVSDSLSQDIIHSLTNKNIDSIAQKRTEDYVSEQSRMIITKQNSVPEDKQQCEPSSTMCNHVSGVSSKQSLCGDTKVLCPKTELRSQVHHDPPDRPDLCVPPEMGFLTRYMAKKDLITSRFASYDDDPTHYMFWKASFQNTLGELLCTPMEHLDLLVGWLGPESGRQAKSIRAANANDPVIAINLIWERLDNRYGSPEIIENSLQRRIIAFPKLTSSHRKEFYDLADLAAEIEAVKRDDRNSVLFSYFDSSYGINKLVIKLPYNLQEKWTNEASRYKLKNQGCFPPFAIFSSFLQNLAKMRNDPGFIYDSCGNSGSTYAYQKRNAIPINNAKSHGPANVTIKKTTLSAEPTGSSDESVFCPLHKTKHSLNECSAFRRKPIDERKNFIFSNGICFKCCGPKKHRAKNCRTHVQCDICKTTTHPTALHLDSLHNEGEVIDTKVKSACTQICGTTYGTSKSCAKILPVNVYSESDPSKTRTVYALIDDQSNYSLATPSFFDAFHENGPEYEYVLVSCAGRKSTSGRRGIGYVIESIGKTHSLKLPTLVECEDVPNNRSEIPSPEVALQYTHLKDIAPSIYPVDDNMEIELLIGRDLIAAHYVLDQRIGQGCLPYAQKLPLGWVILGQVCLGNAHFPEIVNTNKTFILPNGRPSCFEPCDSTLCVKDNPFLKTKHDEKIGLSVEDRNFIQIMNSGFHKDSDGHWVAPLPFRKDKPPLPDNKSYALRRAKSLDLSLKRNPVKYKHVQDFMQKIFERGHAEPAPPILSDAPRWYLPMFGVYHPKKPHSVRVVFDSSAKHNGTSLNDVLMKGPDLSNSLQGILLRFRREQVAITADVEQMFHNFKVQENHRDFLRFMWHPESDLNKPLEEFRMTVHVFGNSPSPAVATYGLRKAVQHAEEEVRSFVNRDFYVDDGLTSRPSEQEAVELMKRTQQALKEGGQLRLNKVASNSKFVLQQFDQDELAKDLKNLDFGHDVLPVQRSLGLSWDIEMDNIIFRVCSEPKPFTRRGVLSTINTIFDPIGFTSPVTLQGKLLLRQMITGTSSLDWDEPIQETFRMPWKTWVDSLCYLEDFQIPRMYSKCSVEHSSHHEVHIFSDASKEAIAAVAFLKVFENEGISDVSFLLGKAKVAPTHGHTIPRLELCAAVLAVDMAETIQEHLDMQKDNFHFYSDSQVVLGYISNETRRFYVYVTNRIDRIRSFCGPYQWNYVPTDCNPADVATRKFNTCDLSQSIWIQGPTFLHSNTERNSHGHFPLVNAEDDVEVKKEITCAKTQLESYSVLECERFSKFSTWASLVRAIMNLKQLVRRHLPLSDKLELNKSSETFIIRQVQRRVFSEEIQAIMEGSSPPTNSPLLSLNPILDRDGILRVGGRISRKRSNKNCYENQDPTCHPVIIPKGQHIAVLLVRHFHAVVHHQGRHLTEGAIRTGGYWIVGAKRLISSVIRQCVTCRKLRGQFGWMQMADLPTDRTEPSPPFTFVGVDTFGPWHVVFRRTRGGQAHHNRWAILFTCMVSRAVHIELIEELSSASFINALRRFVSIRGPVKQFRSDRGTNFVGAVKELNIDADFVENGPVRRYLTENGTTWIFNPPHASHFGGVWERMIGSCRRILDALLLDCKKDLTHEVLSTFMMEVCAILNFRPLIPVSTDPEMPQVLSPSLLLTQKPSTCEQNGLSVFGQKDALKSQWKHVQCLSEQFWSRWHSEYLQHLQIRQKWKSGGVIFKEGDIVVMKDRDCSRNQWPLGIIEETYTSGDDKVRKVKVSVVRGNTRTSYVRPISELVRLVEVD